MSENVYSLMLSSPKITRPSPWAGNVAGVHIPREPQMVAHLLSRYLRHFGNPVQPRDNFPTEKGLMDLKIRSPTATGRIVAARN